jgi:hypothetical protein
MDVPLYYYYYSLLFECGRIFWSGCEFSAIHALLSLFVVLLDCDPSAHKPIARLYLVLRFASLQ